MRIRRKELGLSPESVADALGVSPVRIFRYVKLLLSKRLNLIWCNLCCKLLYFGLLFSWHPYLSRQLLIYLFFSLLSRQLLVKTPPERLQHSDGWCSGL